MKMGTVSLLILSWLCFGLCQPGSARSVSSRPNAVKIGSIFTPGSSIGRVVKIAIEEAVKDVNADPNILRGTKVEVTLQNSNCSGFLGLVEALQLIEADVVAIIGPQCSVVAHIVSYLATALHVPLLSFAATDPTLGSLQFPYFVRMIESDAHQMAAVASIVDYHGWREVIAIFVDDDYGRNGVEALHDKLADRRCRISYKAAIRPDAVIDRGEVEDLLVKLALMESRIIVLHVYSELGFKIFSVAKHLGMMGNDFVWIATDWLATVLDSYSPLPSEKMDSIQGVLVLRQHTPDSQKKRAFHARWNKITNGFPGLNTYGLRAYDSVMLFAHAMDAFFNQGGIISFSNDSRLASLTNGELNLKAMTIFNEGNLLLNDILRTHFVGLTGPVQFGSDNSLIHPAFDIINVIGTGFRPVGFWSNYSGLSTVPPETLYMAPPNTSSQKLHGVIWPGETLVKPRGWVFPNNGKQLKIGVPVRVSYREYVSLQHDASNEMFKGLCIDVFIAAVNLLPYAVPYKFIPFGDGHENPNYDELVKRITTGTFDGVVGDVAIVRNRTKTVDFTQPYTSSGLVVVVPVRKMNSGAWAFLRPFSPQMWLVICCFFIFVGIVIWVLEHRINDDFRGPPRRQAITILWFSFSTMFFSHRESPVSTLGRAVLIIWLFVVLIINASYTASLTSILTVQQLSSPIKGIESLRQSNERIGYQVGSFAERYLRDVLNISENRLVPLGTPQEYAKALKAGTRRDGVAAIVDEKAYVDIFLATNCAFRIVGPEFTKSGWGFAFPRDSSLAVDLSSAILELAENGDLQRIHDKWLMHSTCPLENGELESDRLRLTSFWGLFLICGIAFFVAVLIYFIHIVKRLYRKPGPSEAVSGRQGDGSTHSARLQRLFSIMNEKVEMPKHGKKRKTENSRDVKGAECAEERGDNTIDPLN